MTDLRAEFELAYKSTAELGCFTPDLRLLKNGDYMQPSVYWAFWAWQASRAALKVRLPMWEYLQNGNQAYHATEVKGALKDAGISYE
jgi:hypothetical protein